MYDFDNEDLELGVEDLIWEKEELEDLNCILGMNENEEIEKYLRSQKIDVD